MKSFLVISLALIASLQVSATGNFNLLRELDSALNELSQGQQELSITHDFSERQIYMNRNIMSMYIELMNEQLIGSFMESYAQMANFADEVQAELDTMERDNYCVDRIRRRFAMQVQRYGTFLSRCMRQSHEEIRFWTTHTDELHETAHVSLNQVQNLGLVSLTERAAFTNADSFYPPINRLLRILLSETRAYMDEFEVFRASVVDSEEEILQELTQCDRELVDQFLATTRTELERARDCPPNP